MDERSLEIGGQLPFGELGLPPAVEYVRNLANKLGNNGFARRVMSLARRACLAGRDDPFDIDVFDRCRARLYPRSNRCEKRVFLGVRSWDAQERAAISQELQAAAPTQPFTFVDAGANVGLYSLYVASEGRRLNRDVRILAIEPDPVNLSRLRFNIAASKAHEIAVAPCALGGAEGTGRLLSVQRNRGEVRLAGAGEESADAIDVPVRPLPDILEEAGFDHIDVLKLDIEGAELAVLQSLFDAAPEKVWPSIIILEVGRQGRLTEAHHLCTRAGYAQVQRMQINAVLSRKPMTTTQFDMLNR